MAYLIHYCRTPGRLAAAMSLGTARETLELVRCLAASGFTVRAIRGTSKGGYTITIEQLEARTRPEQRLPATVEQLGAHVLADRPSSVVSDTIMSLIKRHSIAGSYL